MQIHMISRHRINTDGDGVVSLIAMAGCPLDCDYCINKDVLAKNAKDYLIDDITNVLLKDYCYYVSGGGICFGGGEPLLQSNEIKEFCCNIKDLKIRVGIETSLNVPLYNLENVIDYVDYFIIDIKSMNANIYKEYTKNNNNLVIENLSYLQKQKLQNKCLIRIPKILNYNDEKDIKNSIKKLKELGFTNFDIFDYIIDD